MKGLQTKLVSKSHGHHHVIYDAGRYRNGKPIKHVVGYIKEVAANSYHGWMWDSANKVVIYPSLHHAHHALNEQFVTQLVIQRLNQ